jgi:predicted double-glycine peptidase
MSNENNYVEMTFPARLQKYNYDCGVACLQTILTFYGFIDFEDKVVELAKPDKYGTKMKGLFRVAKNYGLKYKTFSNLSIDDLKKYIDRNCPVIIAVQAYNRKEKVFKYSRAWAYGHYVIPIGYDDKKLYYQDPSSEHRTFLTYKEMNERWHVIGDKGEKLFHFGMVIFGPNKTKKVHMK